MRISPAVLAAALAVACSNPDASPDGATSPVDAPAIVLDAPRRDAGGGTPDARRFDAALGAPDAATTGGPGPAPTESCTFTKDADGFFKLTSTKSDYWVRLPPDYDPAHPAPRPMFVALHGCNDNAKNFLSWGAVPFAARATQDYIAISLGGRDGGCWDMGADPPLVLEAIRHVRTCFWAHQKKITIGGYSSGGMLAYNVGFKNAALFAGILIENSGLSQGVGGGNVDAVLTAAAWRIPVAHTARLSDGSFAIAGVRADRDKMIGHDIPIDYRELAGTHDGTSDDWAQFLLPHLAGWAAP